MESWRKVWRDGFALFLPTAGLLRLREYLMTDDLRLLQGATTSPPPLQCVLDWPTEGTCPVSTCAEGETVGEVEEFFGRACFSADQRLGESGACRYFLNWWDDSPRPEARLALLAEVDRTLLARDIALTPGGTVKVVPAA
jgi:hypothetical protein